jgi:hypothetical protein
LTDRGLVKFRKRRRRARQTAEKKSWVFRAQCPEKAMTSSENASKSPCLRVGQDDHGRWIVLDRRGHCGGLFANSKDAIHFAMFESEQRPQAVIMGLRGLRPEM